MSDDEQEALRKLEAIRETDFIGQAQQAIERARDEIIQGSSQPSQVIEEIMTCLSDAKDCIQRAMEVLDSASSSSSSSSSSDSWFY